MDVVFTGWRSGLQAAPLAELLQAEAGLPPARARALTEQLAAIPLEELECDSPEVAASLAAAVGRLGLPCEARGAVAAFSGWRYGLQDKALVDLLEGIADVPPTRARALAHHLSEGPVVLVHCDSEAHAHALVEKAAALGAVCQVTRSASFESE
jgi:hypothetical protein